MWTSTGRSQAKSILHDEKENEKKKNAVYISYQNKITGNIS